MGDILFAGYQVHIPSAGTGAFIITSLNHRQAVAWRDRLLALARKGEALAVMEDVVILRSVNRPGFTGGSLV